MAVLNPLGSGGGSSPVDTYTVATVPDASTVDPDTIIYVEDADAADQWAISDGTDWLHIVGGTRNWFGPAPMPAFDDLVLWLEGDSLVGADGAGVDDWPNDADSDVTVAKIAGAGQPLIRRGVANGHDAVEFQTDKGFKTSGLADIYGGSIVTGMESGEIMVVFKHLTLASSVLVAHSSGGTAPHAMLVNTNGAVSAEGWFDGVFDSANIATGGWHRIDLRMDVPGDLRAGKQDALAEQTNAGDLAGVTFNAVETVLGRHEGGTLPYHGQIAFYAVWSRILTDPERAEARDYIETKYGVAV